LGSEGDKMKKYLVLVLGMLMVFGFAANAFAIHAAIPKETTAVVAPKGTEIRLGGDIRIRGWYEDNITTAAGVRAVTGRPYAGGSMAWYDQRVRLLLDVKTAPNVTGRILLETLPANYTWGLTSTVVSPGTGGARRGTGVAMVEAWIAYTGTGLLGVPAGIRAGHQLLGVGERTFFDHTGTGDDAILLWIEPAKGTDIILATAKLGEVGDAGRTDNTDDVDAYSLMLTHKLDKDNTIGANLSLVTSSDITGGAPVAGAYRLPAATYTTANLNLWNAGLLAKGKISGIGYKATVDFQFGKIKDIIPTAAAPITDLKFSGYGITLGANYKLDPVTIRANYVYGSGDDTITDNKNKAFQTFVDTTIDPNLPTVVYNWRVHSAATGTSLGTGIANTTAYNLGLTFSPIKDMTAHLDYYLLRASKRLSAIANEYGNSKNIGSELDLKLAYRLARNLTYFINSGILFADSFYENRANMPTFDDNAKNAVVFQHAIVLSF
jgi:hypothetical protein